MKKLLCAVGSVFLCSASPDTPIVRSRIIEMCEVKPLKRASVHAQYLILARGCASLESIPQQVPLERSVSKESLIIQQPKKTNRLWATLLRFKKIL